MSALPLPFCFQLLGIKLGDHLALPLLMPPVPAGFPSPAADYIDQHLDLNEHLVSNPASTFFVRVVGESMTGDHIHTGNVLVVDRAMLTGENPLRVLQDPVVLCSAADADRPAIQDFGGFLAR